MVQSQKKRDRISGIKEGLIYGVIQFRLCCVSEDLILCGGERECVSFTGYCTPGLVGGLLRLGY
jgi:hypothetical protein